MTVAIYRLNEEGYRLKSHTELIRVTKIEEDDNMLTIHTYWSDCRGETPITVNLDECGVDVFVGRN